MTTRVNPHETPQQTLKRLEKSIRILERRVSLTGGYVPPTPTPTTLKGTLPWNSRPDEVYDGALSVPFVFTFSGTFTNARASCGISPTGSATFDVKLNGTTILPSLVTIASAGTLSADVVPTVTTFARNDVLQVICGTANGILDVILYIDYTRTS